MANQLFYYFGDDEAYFKTLVAEFKKSTRLQIEFKKIFESDKKKIQSLFLKIVQKKPTCVFIDFSKHTQDYLHLARIISRTSLGYPLVKVGLADYLSPPEILMESIATGVDLTHIKSPESYDVAFDVAKLIAPNEMGEHGFATTKLKEEWEVGIPAKVGYVHPEGIHFETDYRLQKGDRIRLNHPWTKKRVVPSKEFFVQEVTSKNLFYHFNYAADVEFLFIDEFLPPEGMEEDRIEEKRKERDELIEFHRKQLSKWIDENDYNSLEKKAKVLIVDSDFHFYDDQERTDSHPYTIRCLSYIDDIGAVIERMEPQVIAFNLEKDTKPGARNTMEQLGKLVQAVKVKMQDAPPFIVVFNSPANSLTLQGSLHFQHILATESDLSVDLLLRMADIFEKKLKKSQEAPKPKKLDRKVFLKKSNLASVLEILIPITVIKLSECNLVFQTDAPITVGMNLHLTSPIDMFINVQPMKSQSKTPEYLGLIHCMNEEQKKELRKYVNSVFFRDHDAKVNAEKEVFMQLNEVKLHQKEEAIKKAQEDQENDPDQEKDTPETKS